MLNTLLNSTLENFLFENQTSCRTLPSVVRVSTDEDKFLELEFDCLADVSGDDVLVCNQYINETLLVKNYFPG